MSQNIYYWSLYIIRMIFYINNKILTSKLKKKKTNEYKSPPPHYDLKCFKNKN